MLKNKLNLKVPIIQGGMGVGVSLGNLAGHVALEGGMGVISSVNPGYRDPEFNKRPMEVNKKAFRNEIRKAKEIAKGNGKIAVNIMVATSSYNDMVQIAVEEKVDAIISGAGLPTTLPEFIKDSDTMGAPIVSSGKAAKLLCKVWDNRFEMVPDFFVIEGYQAGGHLGFKREDIESGNVKELDEILLEVLLEIAPYEEKYARKIPVFVAGGVFDGADMARLMKAGASGVQIATRFILTEECDASLRYKEIMRDAKEEDIVLVKSPVGMPGRALKSPLIQQVEKGIKFPATICNNCIKECEKGERIPYCISKALVDAANGIWETGLFFCGAKLGQMNCITTVKEVINEMMTSYQKAIG